MSELKECVKCKEEFQEELKKCELCGKHVCNDCYVSYCGFIYCSDMCLHGDTLEIPAFLEVGKK